MGRRGTGSDYARRRSDQKAQETAGCVSVLLALVGQRQGLVLTGPLFAVVGDCGETRRFA